MQIHTNKLPTLIQFAHKGPPSSWKREHPEHARSGRTRGAEARSFMTSEHYSKM